VKVALLRGGKRDPGGRKGKKSRIEEFASNLGGRRLQERGRLGGRQSELVGLRRGGVASRRSELLRGKGQFARRRGNSTI